MLRDIKARRQAICDHVGADGALLMFTSDEKIRSHDTLYPYRPDSDFLYLTTFAEPESILLVLPEHDSHEFTLFVRPRDPEREIWDGFRHGPEGAKKFADVDQAYPTEEFNDRFVELIKGRQHLFYPFGEKPTRDQKIVGLLKKLHGRGRSPDRGPRSFVDPRPELHRMRRLKSREEVQRIEAAAECSAYAQLHAMKIARPGMMEYELQAEIEHEMKRLGANGPAYATIVAGGANACILHYIENRQTLRDGELVLIDAGAEVNWYAGDITRTFPVGQRFTDGQRAVYEAVLSVQVDAISRARAGVTWQDHHHETRRQLCAAMVDLGLLDGSVGELIDEDEDRRHFMHGTGHYLGLDVHDVGPYATWDAEQEEAVPVEFEEGVVLTIEPGLYIQPDASDAPEDLRGTGIRIEDDIVIKDKGEPTVLTSKVPKDVAAVEEIRSEALASPST